MDLPVIRCSACGGPLSQGAMRCAFCGSQIAQAACPGCLALVPWGAHHCPGCGRELAQLENLPGPAMKCPGCGGGLGSVRVGRIPMRPCSACGGIWLGRDDFEELARTHEAQDLFLGSPHGRENAGDRPASLAEVRYRPCPACGKFMNRINYARISGVILDSCRDHGLWFDQDELRKVVLFLEEGGLERAARREREAAASANPRHAGELNGGPMLADGIGGNPGQGNIPGLVAEILIDAARLLAAKVR